MIPIVPFSFNFANPCDKVQSSFYKTVKSIFFSNCLLLFHIKIVLKETRRSDHQGPDSFLNLLREEKYTEDE